MSTFAFDTKYMLLKILLYVSTILCVGGHKGHTFFPPAFLQSISRPMVVTLSEFWRYMKWETSISTMETHG